MKKWFLISCSFLLLTACKWGGSFNRYEVNNISLRVHFRGMPKNPPLLFIHGNNGSHANGWALIEHFQHDYFIIAPDSRYHGESSHDGRELTYDLMAEDYHQLLRKLKLDSVILIGESDGGIIGLILAMEHPDQIKQLVTIGANIRPDTTALIASDVQNLKKDLATLAAQINAGDSTSKKLRQRSLLRLMDRYPQIPDSTLAKISCPTLVISGEHDVIKKRHSAAIAGNIPKGQLQIVPGAGHNLIHDKPAVLIELIQLFLKNT